VSVRPVTSRSELVKPQKCGTIQTRNNPQQRKIMKIEITKEDQKLFNTALDAIKAQVQRQINTEKVDEIKELRKKQLGELNNLQAKLNTQELIK